jgi:pyrroline-5-carboxylate reductase
MIIGFLGAGVMARALAKGLVDHVVNAEDALICSAPTAQDVKPFLDLFPGARWTTDNSEVMRASDLTILAIKPQVFPEAMAGLKTASAGKLVLSIAAGMTIEKIRSWLDASARVVRAMPNTPMQIGRGASVYAGEERVSPRDYELIHRILSSSGKAWRVEEKQIDAVTALSGSGPAYVFHFIDALARGGVALGLPEKLAHELAIQTVLGSAQLASDSSKTALELAAQVKSPRGTTLAGCAVLEENDALNSLMAKCMTAARNRAEALARGED